MCERIYEAHSKSECITGMVDPKTQPEPDKGGDGSGKQPPKTKVGYSEPSGEPPKDSLLRQFHPDTIRVIVYGYDEAKAFGHNYLGTEHIVLGLVASRTLQMIWFEFGTTVQKAR